MWDFTVLTNQELDCLLHEAKAEKHRRLKLQQAQTHARRIPQTLMRNPRNVEKEQKIEARRRYLELDYAIDNDKESS